MKIEQRTVEKIAYCNLWGMRRKNVTKDDLLKKMESYEDNIPAIQLYCSYKYKDGSIDMDDSRGNSPFIRKIYNILWGRKDKKTNGVADVNGYTNFRKTFIFDDVLMGGETINTMQSYIKSVLGYTKKYLKKRYLTDSAFVENMLIENGLKPICESNFFIGNYVMVPAYFNGKSHNVQDRWVTKLPQLIDGWIYNDKFLIRLYHDKDGTNGYKKREKAYTLDQMKLLCEAYDEFPKGAFTKYINTMFLWDYTCKTDNKYEVVSDEKRNEEFLKKCSIRVKRRSLFMAMMLLIAKCDSEETLEKVEFPNEWNNWYEASSLYKGLIYKIFCEDQVYESYDDVFRTIEKAYLWKKESKIKKYINCTKNLIDNIN